MSLPHSHPTMTEVSRLLPKPGLVGGGSHMGKLGFSSGLGPAAGASPAASPWSNLGPFFLNVSTSIGIIALNKILFTAYGFEFATLITILHFCATAVGLEACARGSVFARKRLPLSDVLPLSVLFCGYVVLTNLSLQYNTVGLFQVSKILVTPCVVALETHFGGRAFPGPVKAALLLTCVGVAVATVADLAMNWLGSAVALAGVLCTACYQIQIGSRMAALQVNSMQLLYYQAPLSAAMLVPVLPFLDDLPALAAYARWSRPMAAALLGSALLAFFVNVSVFLIIGKTSPVSYNVLGHMKTCLILVLGFVAFGDSVSRMKLLGIACTMTGVIWYSILKLSGAGGGQPAIKP